MSIRRERNAADGPFVLLGLPHDAPRGDFNHPDHAISATRRQLAVALIVNSGLGTPFGDLRIARIGAATGRVADFAQIEG